MRHRHNGQLLGALGAVTALVFAAVLLGPAATASANSCSIVDPGCETMILINGWPPNENGAVPYCLGISGSIADMQACSGYADQDWALNNLSNENFYRIENRDDQCLEPKGKSQSDNVEIVPTTCTSIGSNGAEYWEVVDDTNVLSSCYQTEYFINWYSGYVIGVKGGDKNVDVTGTPITQQGFQNSCNDQWWSFGGTPYS